MEKATQPQGERGMTEHGRSRCSNVQPTGESGGQKAPSRSLLHAALRYLTRSGEDAFCMNGVCFVNHVQQTVIEVVEYADELHRAEKGFPLNERTALFGRPKSQVKKHQAKV